MPPLPFPRFLCQRRETAIPQSKSRSELAFHPKSSRPEFPFQRHSSHVAGHSSVRSTNTPTSSLCLETQAACSGWVDGRVRPPCSVLPSQRARGEKGSNRMSAKPEASVPRDEDMNAAGRFVSPESDVPRGRKRHRREEVALVTATTTTAKQIPSGESATFRGRCRNRSTSVITISTFSSSRNASRSAPRDSSCSPARRTHLVRFVKIGRCRKRSQSPSRSRSPNSLKDPGRRRRRRQRTRSRGRDHAVEIQLPLKFEITTDRLGIHDQ
ncbi:hypothetical protein B0T24DRAFT_349744 [Lasiosphaeria ovina]|uniref:Uncharacterized protein n=1 Tax=Lasiosphaeria ovina TaxID=92902 RepID=A0AAE0N4D6_9PEZI|nr:hypothetical protein B0T24DRAFT_349744 [Lasiosphaeria ovina]